MSFSMLLVFMSTNGLQIPDKNYIIKYKDVMNEAIEGYKVAYEKKKQILYSRMDDSMIKKIKGKSGEKLVYQHLKSSVKV